MVDRTRGGPEAGANARREALGPNRRLPVPFRLEEYRELERQAAARGMDMGRLIREWVLPHLEP